MTVTFTGMVNYVYLPLVLVMSAYRQGRVGFHMVLFTLIALLLFTASTALGVWL